MEYNLDWLIHDYGKFLEKFGLNEASVREHYTVWKERSQSESVLDYLWYLFEVILGETAKQIKNESDLQKNNLEVYSAMWFFQTHVLGQEANELLELINQTKIKLWQLQLPFHFHIKIAGDDCCSYCNQWHSQLLNPEDLSGNNGFSPLHCTNDNGCTCILAPVAQRDENDQILLKTAQAN